MDALEAKSSARATRAKNLRHKAHGRGGKDRNQGEHHKEKGRLLPNSSSLDSQREREPFSGKKFDDATAYSDIASVSVPKFDGKEARGGGGGGGEKSVDSQGEREPFARKKFDEAARNSGIAKVVVPKPGGKGVVVGRGGGGGGGERSVERLICDRSRYDGDGVWSTGSSVSEAECLSSRVGQKHHLPKRYGDLGGARHVKEGKEKEDDLCCRLNDANGAGDGSCSQEAAEGAVAAWAATGCEQGGGVFFAAVPATSQGADYGALIDHQFGDFSFAATARLQSSWKFSQRWGDFDFDFDFAHPVSSTLFPFQQSATADATKKQPREDLLSVDLHQLADALATMPLSFCLSVEEHILPQEMRGGPTEASSSDMEPPTHDNIECTDTAAVSSSNVEAWSVDGRSLPTNSFLSSERAAAGKRLMAISIAEPSDGSLLKSSGKSEEEQKEQKSSYLPVSQEPMTVLASQRPDGITQRAPASLHEEEKEEAPVVASTWGNRPEGGHVFPLLMGHSKVMPTNLSTACGNHSGLDENWLKEGEMHGTEEDDSWFNDDLSRDNKVADSDQRVVDNQTTGNYRDNHVNNAVEARKPRGKDANFHRAGTKSMLMSKELTAEDVRRTPECLRAEDELDDLLDLLDGVSGLDPGPGPGLMRREILSTGGRADASSVAAVPLPGRQRSMEPLLGPIHMSRSEKADDSRHLGGFPKPAAAAAVDRKYSKVQGASVGGQRETAAQVHSPSAGWLQRQGQKERQGDGLGFAARGRDFSVVGPRKVVASKDSSLGVRKGGANEGPKGTVKTDIRPNSHMNVAATAAVIDDDEFDAWFDSIP